MGSGVWYLTIRDIFRVSIVVVILVLVRQVVVGYLEPWGRLVPYLGVWLHDFGRRIL